MSARTIRTTGRCRALAGVMSIFKTFIASMQNFQSCTPGFMVRELGTMGGEMPRLITKKAGKFGRNFGL